MLKILSVGCLMFSGFFSPLSHGVELNDLKARIDLKKNPAPNLNDHRGPILGTCEGVKYYEQAELDGCIRNVSARSLSVYVPGTGKVMPPSRPVPTNEGK